MINKILSPLILISLFFLNCELIPENTDIFNPISNHIFNPDSIISDKKKGEGLCIYPTKIQYDASVIYQNFDIDTARIIGGPIISYNEIASYDTTSHILELTYSLDSLRSKLGSISVHGKSFLVTLDYEKMYNGWFWTGYSSIRPYNCVIIYPEPFFDSLKTNEIRIRRGFLYQDPYLWKDPRKNRQIFDRLIKDGKAK